MTTITIETLTKLFLWMTIINFGVLILYFLLTLFCMDFIYKLHGMWFKMPKER